MARDGHVGELCSGFAAVNVAGCLACFWVGELAAEDVWAATVCFADLHVLGGDEVLVFVEMCVSGGSVSQELCDCSWFEFSVDNGLVPFPGIGAIANISPANCDFVVDWILVSFALFGDLCSELIELIFPHVINARKSFVDSGGDV